MPIDRWGSTSQNSLVINNAAGAQTGPAVADNGGTEFAVAWIQNNTISVSFFDEQGLPNPVLPTAVVTDGVGTAVQDLQMVAGGTGLGYGIGWQETNGGIDQLKLRYYDAVVGTVGGITGGEISISANAGVNQHDLAISAYTQDDPTTGRPSVDGFDVAWVEGNGGAHALGSVYLQRFAVPLDDRKDPVGAPVAVGLDGKVGGAGVNPDAQVLISNAGRDPSVAGLLGAANETVVTWIDANNRINISVFNDNGTVNNNSLGVAINNVNTAAAPMVAGSQQHVMALAGGGFVLAWVATSGANNFIASRVFTPGATAGTFVASPVAVLDTLDGASNGISDFTLAQLQDSGGFSVSWTALDDPDGAGPIAGTQAIHTRSFTAGGAANELVPSIFHAPVDATNVATTGMIGDRFIAVYQDNSTPGDASNIGAQMFDARLDAAGNPILLNGPGVTLVGDPNAGRGRVDPDVLVGSNGNDLISGLGASDTLDGGLGNDRILAGAGNDAIDGGGNAVGALPLGTTLSDGTVLTVGGDTVVFTGRFLNDGIADANDDYAILDIGGGLFQVTDLRAGSPDGVDIIRNVEFFEFLGNAPGAQVVATAALGAGPQITPTAWGWTNADADTAPDTSGAPDVDGFLVDIARAGNGAVDANPYVADSVGEFIAVAWESTAVGATESHIFGRFYDVIGAPDGFIPNVIALSDGIGVESNAVIVSGGANSGWGLAFEQRDSAADTSRELRTNFMGPGQLTGTEVSVFVEGASVDQHDIDLSESMLDRRLVDGVMQGPDVILPAGMNDGYNVVWTSTHLDGADGALPVGYGRIMMQRFEVPLDALGNPGTPVAAGVDGIAGSGSDAAVWVGAETSGVGGAFGRNASSAALHTFETGIVWVAQDGAGGEDLLFRSYDDLGQVINHPANISGAFKVAAGTNAHIVSAGAVNFAIAWVTADASSPSGFSVMGTMLSSAGNGLNGAGFGFGASAVFKLAALPAGFNPATANFQLTGLSGEDSNDVVIAWNMNGATTGADLRAQHIKVTLDPATGIAIGMSAEGASVVVNAETASDQDGGSIAGLLGDRFISVWHEANATYADGNDIVARIIDTRDAVNPDPIIGDFVQPDGGVQARRDVLVGTNGNDNIKGDISDIDGLVDWIYAGMGDDTIQGGPGLRGAAGIPEIIDGGEGNDTAVYTGRLQDYSITVNGDGSFEVIDLRPDGAGTLVHDGIDNLYSIENLRFLDLANGGVGAQTISFNSPGTSPPLDPSYNGTPVAWSLDDTTAYKEIAVDHNGGAQSGIAVTNLQDGAGLAWVEGVDEVWAITYDTTGLPDPILLGANTELTDGTFAGNTVADIDVAMTGGLGMTAVWESINGADSAIHLRFASTNTHLVLDTAGGVPGPGLPGGEIVVVDSDAAGIAIDPVIQGYEIVDGNNDTLEVGFHVGFIVRDGVNDTSTGDAYGALTLARYEIPVYDILVDAAGLPILDGAGQGQLATDPFGNLIPSTTATFGTGSETAPISVGLDGLRGTADDGAAIVLTDQGLRAANNLGSATPIQGRDISVGSLHDGQLVVSFIGSDELVHLKVFIPAVDEAGDRETGGLGLVDVVAGGITTYSELTLPAAMTASLGGVAAGQTAFIAPQQNGSFGVFWAAAGAVAGTVDVKGIIYSGAGTNWSPSPVITFETGLPATTAFQVASTGVTPGGLEDGFFVSWETAAGISGQRFDMTGVKVGDQMVVGDPTSGIPGVHATAGIDDGRMIVGYVDGADVSAQYLDNRQAGVALIGPRTGAPADVIAGTVGDDAIDGRALNDQLFGGLGDDLITMGTGNDIGFGGRGNDQIIGGSGQDQLLGEAGDDLLWGGLSGPADPQVDRDLQAGLTAAGVSAALIATDPGADFISGGDGEDTISFQGEFGRFIVDLGQGIVTSDRDQNGSFVLEDVIGQIVADGAGGTIFQFVNDVENATGGLGNDTLIGNAGDNVLAGGGGNDSIDGAGGIDTALFAGPASAFTVSRDAAGVITVTYDDPAVGGAVNATTTLQNIDFLQFADRRVAAPAGVTAATAVTALTSVNTAPVAADDGSAVAPIQVLPGHTVLLDVLANDTDPDGGQTLAVTAINGIPFVDGSATIASGTVTLLSNGKLSFTPNASFTGTTSFTYTVSDGSGGTATATVSLADQATGIVNSGAATVVVTGSPVEHGVLTAVVGADPDGGGGAAATLQWLRDGAITGETGATFTLGAADVGHLISVRATYTDTAGFNEIVTSAPTAAVTGVDDGDATATITGSAIEHQLLTATVAGDPDGDGAATFQWLRNGVAIANATTATYTLVAADAGAAVSVQASYIDGQAFSETVVSAATAAVTGVNDGHASIVLAGSPVVGQILSYTLGADPDGAGTAPTQQWLRNGVAITNATGPTYTVTTDDIGTAISVRAMRGIW